eukprot:11260263-Ditylum_brightwellii.AAC.1
MAMCDGRDVFQEEVHGVDVSTAKVEEGATKVEQGRVPICCCFTILAGLQKEEESNEQEIK